MSLQSPLLIAVNFASHIQIDHAEQVHRHANTSRRRDNDQKDAIERQIEKIESFVLCAMAIEDYGPVEYCCLAVVASLPYVDRATATTTRTQQIASTKTI